MLSSRKRLMQPTMPRHMEKIKDGKYLKNYELTYRNKIGKEKKYEIVSRGDITGPKAIGKRVSGVSIVAYHDEFFGL